MLAKGRLLGVQFRALLTDRLYFDLARHANEMAFRLRDGFAALGYKFRFSPSNQQFPVMNIQTAESWHPWGMNFRWIIRWTPIPPSTRFVTSWATPESAVDDLLSAVSVAVIFFSLYIYFIGISVRQDSSSPETRETSVW